MTAVYSAGRLSARDETFHAQLFPPLETPPRLPDENIRQEILPFKVEREHLDRRVAFSYRFKNYVYAAERHEGWANFESERSRTVTEGIIKRVF